MNPHEHPHIVKLAKGLQNLLTNLHYCLEKAKVGDLG
jgi:hypothetical protein